MAAILLPNFSRVTDANGNPISGGMVKFYLSGTSTPEAAHANANMTASLGVSVEADGAGRLPPIYLDASKEFRGVFTDAEGTPLPDMDFDPISDTATLGLVLGELAKQTGADRIGKAEGGTVQDAIDDIARKADKTTLIIAGDGLTGGGAINTDRTLAADIATDAEAVAGTSETKLLSAASGLALVNAEIAGLELAIANGTVAALVTAVEEDQADLYANLVPAAEEFGIVWGDADPAKNGFYIKIGATTTGSWGGPLFQDYFRAYADDILSDAEDARDDAIAQNAGGQLGDLKVKLSDGTTTGWTSRPALGDQPSAAADFTLTAGNPDGGQFMRTAATSPVYAADGDNLQITSPTTTFAWAFVLLPMTAAPNRVFDVTYEVGALDADAGVAIGFTATAPTIGGPAVLNTPVDFGGMVWRLGGSGVRTTYGPDGATAPATLVIDAQGNGGIDNADFGAGPGDTVGFRVEFDALGTSAHILHLVNGRVLRGVSDGYTDISGILANSYIAVGMHGGISAPDDVVIVGPAALYTASLDLKRNIYADASHMISGTGTQDDPLLEPDEVAKFIALDRQRRQFRIRLRGGTYAKPLIIPDTTFIDELIIEAPQGEKCIIQPAELLEGDGLWSAIGGTTNLKRRPAVFGAGTAFEIGQAGLIEVRGTTAPTLSQTVGQGGFTHSYPWYLYRRQANDFSLATLDQAGNAGSFTVHTTGTHTGYIIVHARGSADPNDLAFRRPLEESAVAIMCKDPDDWNLTRVLIDGIESRYTYSHGFNFQRVRLVHGPLVARGTIVGHGFEYDECVARGYGPISEGTGGDGYNMNGTFGNLPEGIEPWLGLWDAKALGSPLTTFFGDGFSNHEHQRIFLDNCLALGMSKDGLSAGGDYTVSNSSFLGCLDSGIKQYGVAGVATKGMIRGAHIGGCGYGLSNLQTELAGTGRMDARDVLFESMVTYAAYAVGAGATINLLGRPGYVGAAPASGYYGGDGTITLQTVANMPAVS